MSYRLFVRPLPPFVEPAQQRFSWVLQDAGGDAQAQGDADLREDIEQTLARNSLDNVELLGLIPADDTVFCTADIPAKQARYVAQALPYAVEEQVAQDVETLHFALGRHTADGYQVAVIDKGQMSVWKHLLSGWHHAPLAAIYADATLLPATENGWTLCLDGAMVLLRSDRGEWLAVRRENLPMFAHTMAEPPANLVNPTPDDVAAEVPIRIFHPVEGYAEEGGVTQHLAQASDRLRVSEEPLELSVTGFLAWSYHQQLCDPIDFCQGEFSLKEKGHHPLSPWKPLIAVAGLWFVLQVALEIGFGLYQQHQAEQLQERAMAMYRQIFPEDNRTHAGNVRRVIQGQLRAAESNGTQTDFLTLLKFTGAQYTALPDTQSVSFDSINYARARGELVVSISADSYDQLSLLRNGLTDEGLQAQIGSVVNEPAGARGRLTVSGGQ
ncbi:type II secretion system protein GspL [Marinobacter nauticus]